MPKEEDAVCSNCRYWEPTGPADRGECRREPPVIDLELSRAAVVDYLDEGHWPMTRAGEWCGEFRAGDPKGTPALAPAGQEARKP
jgi:hypothetical protein